MGPILPPNQQWAAPGKWPFVGEREPLPLTTWEGLEIVGEVERPSLFRWDELADLPLAELVTDIHCVTRWSKPTMRFRGVWLAELLRRAAPRPAARYVSFVAHSSRAHSTSLLLTEALDLGTLVATAWNGAPLSVEHGGPARAIVPARYFYKSLKWLARIELLASDRPGYWESSAGYHNHAEPWREERFAATGVDRQLLARCLANLDFQGVELRNLDLAGQRLEELRAADARLRNAQFTESHLARADFARANLSNASFRRADLRGASFRDADCEGADFRGADLRGADFRGASLFGATFRSIPSVAPTTIGSPLSNAANFSDEQARVDAETRFDPTAVEILAPGQFPEPN